MPDENVEEVLGKLQNAAYCCCFITWLQPLPNPFVVSSSTVTANWSGWIETNTETGDFFRNALVLYKFYDTNTLKVLHIMATVIALPMCPYTRTQTRNLRLVWGMPPWAWTPWSAFTAPVFGATYTTAQMFTLVGLTECTAVGLACP